MIPQNDMCAVVNYGSSASYCDLPAPEQIATGVIPLDSLPAAWWNAMWNATNGAVNQARCELGVLIDEINSVLQQAGVCPNPACVDQLYQSINKLRQILGNATTAGAVKSSPNPSEVAIDQTTGIMSVNCLGNAASLTTSARTVVGAINELKSTYDCCFSDTATALSGKAPTSHASSATTYGVGTATEYGHLKISDTYATLVGDAAAGIAASQKAVNDLYNLIPQGDSVQWCDSPQLTSYPLVGCVGPATIGAAVGVCVGQRQIMVNGEDGASCSALNWMYPGFTCICINCRSGCRDSSTALYRHDRIEFRYLNSDLDSAYVRLQPIRANYATCSVCCTYNCCSAVTAVVTDACFYQWPNASHTCPLNQTDGMYITIRKTGNTSCCGCGMMAYICNNSSNPIYLSWVQAIAANCTIFYKCATIPVGCRQQIARLWACCSNACNMLMVHVQPYDSYYKWVHIPLFYPQNALPIYPNNSYAFATFICCSDLP